MKPPKGTTATPRANSVAFLATDWEPERQNTKQGFCTITMPSGLRIRRCIVHELNGKRWVLMPAKPWTKPDGTTSYVCILDFVGPASKDLWQQHALAAVEALLGPVR